MLHILRQHNVDNCRLHVDNGLDVEYLKEVINVDNSKKHKHSQNKMFLLTYEINNEQRPHSETLKWKSEFFN